MLRQASASPPGPSHNQRDNRSSRMSIAICGVALLGCCLILEPQFPNLIPTKAQPRRASRNHSVPAGHTLAARLEQLPAEPWSHWSHSLEHSAAAPGARGAPQQPRTGSDNHRLTNTGIVLVRQSTCFGSKCKSKT